MKYGSTLELTKEEAKVILDLLTIVEDKGLYFDDVAFSINEAMNSEDLRAVMDDIQNTVVIIKE